MSEAEEEPVFVVTQQDLLEQLGEGAVPFSRALADSRARTKARPGTTEEIVVKVQGGHVTKIRPWPDEWQRPKRP